MPPVLKYNVKYSFQHLLSSAAQYLTMGKRKAQETPTTTGSKRCDYDDATDDENTAHISKKARPDQPKKRKNKPQDNDQDASQTSSSQAPVTAKALTSAEQKKL
ncbi:hypothetical protein VKT23_008186 [Stygiomarasmius scandens]|uniref:Uncharacterized protein n=1 Tax=Marasmiellus scandens TaxID=2682957 RepID=A0ABR1JIE6_9AGAR